MTIILLIFSIYLFFEIDKTDKKFAELKDLTVRIKNESDKAITSIDSLSQELKKQLSNQYKKNLSQVSEILLNEKLKTFESQLLNIQKKIDDETANLKKIKSQKRRGLLNLPEQVDLDDLYVRYKKLNSVSFDTDKGSINFNRYNIEITIVPSLQKPAWIRIGKEKSEENSALIKAWLSESAKEKIRQGYKSIHNKTRPSDYGEYTVKLYRKGDMYFKTYYQYIRFQGTYNSTYYRYTFYVEVGSQKRKELYFREQYNSKLGS